MTSNFWKGTESNRFQSNGNFASSGVNSLNHSLNRLGASFSMLVPKLSKPSSSHNLRMSPQHLFGNQSANGFSAPMTFGARIR